MIEERLLPRLRLPRARAGAAGGEGPGRSPAPAARWPIAGRRANLFRPAPDGLRTRPAHAALRLHPHQPPADVGALVSAYSMRRNSRPTRFDVRLIEHKDHPASSARRGPAYLRDGDRQIWRNDDLQSFTPLRFMPPELMGYEGRAVIMDPDIFAVGDIWELLTRDMEGKALMCRSRPSQGPPTLGHQGHAARLREAQHWRTEPKTSTSCSRSSATTSTGSNLQLRGPGHYRPVRGRVERLRPADRQHQADAQHAAEDPAVEDAACRSTSSRRRNPADPADGWLSRLRRQLFGEYGMPGSYKPHPDPQPGAVFFCAAEGVRRAGRRDRGAPASDDMRDNHVRHDAFEVLERTPAARAGAAEGRLATRRRAAARAAARDWSNQTDVHSLSV